MGMRNWVVLSTLAVALAPSWALAQDDVPVDVPVDSGGGDVPMDMGTDTTDMGTTDTGDATVTDGGTGTGSGSSATGARVTAGPRGATGAFSEGMTQRATGGNNVLWTLTLGGTLTYGNARTGGVTASTSLQLRDGPDVGIIEASFQYSVAQAPLTCQVVRDPPGGLTIDQAQRDFCNPEVMDPSMVALAPGTRAPGFNNWAETAVNLQWRARYDHYFDDENAVFVAHVGRADRFAGLVPRLAIQIGWNHVLMHERNHSLAFDLGADVTIDLFTDAVRNQIIRQTDPDLTMPPLVLPPTWTTDYRVMPQVLLRINYINHLTNLFTYDTTFEAFWDVVDYTHLRFQWVNHFRSQIDNIFQFRLDLTGRFDSQPPGQAVSWNEDPIRQTTTMFEFVGTINLQGTFDLDGAPPPAAEGEGGGHGHGSGGSGSSSGSSGSSSGSGGGGSGGSRGCRAGESCLSTGGGGGSSSSSSGGGGSSSSSSGGRGSSSSSSSSSGRGGRGSGSRGSSGSGSSTDSGSGSGDSGSGSGDSGDSGSGDSGDGSFQWEEDPQ